MKAKNIDELHNQISDFLSQTPGIEQVEAMQIGTEMYETTEGMYMHTELRYWAILIVKGKGEGVMRVESSLSE